MEISGWEFNLGPWVPEGLLFLLLLCTVGYLASYLGRCTFLGGQLFLYSINIASKYKEPIGLQCCGRPQASFTDAHLARSHERNCLPESETCCKNTTKPNRTIQTRSCFGPERSGIALTCCQTVTDTSFPGTHNRLRTRVEGIQLSRRSSDFL